MRKLTTMILTSGCLSLALIGCGNNEGATGLQNQQNDLFKGYSQPNQHFVMNRQANGDVDHYLRFGFGRFTSDTAYSGQSIPEYAVYDRSLMAETISKLAATLQNVDEVAVLVTDQHVLLAYDANNTDRDEVATQVKKTALSVVPAYYDVYVADDPRLMLDIERFQGLSPKNRDYAETLDATIEDMKTYPQGETVDLQDPLLKDTRYDDSNQGTNQGMNEDSTNRMHQRNQGSDNNKTVPNQ